ncbi:phosphoserine phosphatase SerB [Alginatibacterium sediminis]|uniref:phosphoserine phosphatase SerB n=1 Tax=Alginatibacterium sediminis TaxID=2164068 RepID=UPI001F16741E|nr:phosphoserine phosphatase SerB [Alginatibacterium sediminis]
MEFQAPNTFDSKLAVWGQKQALHGFWNADHKAQIETLGLSQYLLIWAPQIAFEHLEKLWDDLELYAYQNYCHQSATIAGHTAVLVQTSASTEELKTKLLRSKSELDAVILGNLPDLDTPGLLVMDMDSTTIQIECIDEIARLAGVGEKVSAVTAAAMRGEIDFEQSLRQRVALLEGAPESILQEVANNMPLMPGLELLLEALQQHGWKTAIASGGFTYFAKALQQAHGFDFVYANELEIDQGKLSGKVQGDVVDAKAKATALAKWATQCEIPNSHTVAVGDGANDLLMMQTAGLGIAIHAKPLVVEQAQAAVRHSDLEAVLLILSAGTLVN